MRYRDRLDAGAVLAEALGPRPGALVLGLPRGGVPVADVVARRLGLPLDVWVAKKIAVPRQPEVGLGAVSEGDVVVVDHALVGRCGVDDVALADAIAAVGRVVRERATVWRGGRPPPEVRGRTVIVVDDGVANGVTAAAALRALRAAGAGRLVLAVPVGSRAGLAVAGAEADEVVCPLSPRDFRAVGDHYLDFAQVQDAEVLALLARR